VGNSIVQKLTMSEMKDRIGNLAQTNYYYVEMTLSKNLEAHFKNNYPGDPSIDAVKNFVKRLGYLCSECSLPTTSYATAEVKDNFMGVTQEFAHTRLYTDIDLTFYVDADYQVLRFFEGWMDYIAGGNSPSLGEPAAASSPSTKIYRRFNYPEDYKMQNMKIFKFERDYKKQLEYTFINAFPKSVATVPVSYGAADILKVTVSFNFDRYIVKRSDLPVEEDKERKIENPTPGNNASISQPRLINGNQTIDQMINDIKAMQEASRLRQSGYSPGLGAGNGAFGPGF